MHCGRIDIAYKIEELYLGTVEDNPDINVISSGEEAGDSQLALNNENISTGNQPADQTITDQSESVQPISSAL
mgnify:FL=1